MVHHMLTWCGAQPFTTCCYDGHSLTRQKKHQSKFMAERNLRVTTFWWPWTYGFELSLWYSLGLAVVVSRFIALIWGCRLAVGDVVSRLLMRICRFSIGSWGCPSWFRLVVDWGLRLLYWGLTVCGTPGRVSLGWKDWGVLDWLGSPRLIGEESM